MLATGVLGLERIPAGVSTGTVQGQFAQHLSGDFGGVRSWSGGDVDLAVVELEENVGHVRVEADAFAMSVENLVEVVPAAEERRGNVRIAP
jgi:hypothetical protein